MEQIGAMLTVDLYGRLRLYRDAVVIGAYKIGKFVGYLTKSED